MTDNKSFTVNRLPVIPPSITTCLAGIQRTIRAVRGPYRPHAAHCTRPVLRKQHVENVMRVEPPFPQSVGDHHRGQGQSAVLDRKSMRITLSDLPTRWVRTKVPLRATSTVQPSTSSSRGGSGATDG